MLTCPSIHVVLKYLRNLLISSLFESITPCGVSKDIYTGRISSSGSSGNAISFRIHTLKVALCVYNFASPIFLTFSKTAFLKWNQQPIIVIYGYVCARAFFGAISKSPIAKEGLKSGNN